MQYQYSHTISKPDSASVNKVLRNTYLLLAMTLVCSTVTAWIAMALQLSHITGFMLSLLALVTVFLVISQAKKASGIAWVFVFTCLMGASIGPMLNHYADLPDGGELIMLALGSTALIFFSLSAYTLTSKKDFSFMGNFLFVGLIVVIVAGIANLFFQIPALHLAINAVVVLLMSGFILYDTSEIVNGGETNYILATVNLYLNLFNLFTSLLQLFGAFSSDD